MNSEKIVGKIAELKILLDDWDDLESHDLQKQAETLVIQKAAELVEIATEEVKPKKSEMACNCPHECEGEELPKEFIDALNSVANILGHMTETQKNALASKICTEMHFDILQAVRKTFEN